MIGWKWHIVLRNFVPRKCAEFLPMLNSSLVLKFYIMNWCLKNNGESHAISYVGLYFSSVLKKKTDYVLWERMNKNVNLDRGYLD